MSSGNSTRTYVLYVEIDEDVGCGSMSFDEIMLKSKTKELDTSWIIISGNFKTAKSLN